jgi:hypothetical protein
MERDLQKTPGLREVVWVIMGSDGAERRTSTGFDGFGGAINLGAFLSGQLYLS